MLVNLTIELTGAPSTTSVAAVRGALSSAFLVARPASREGPAPASDHVERSCVQENPCALLEGLAARRPAQFVQHGSLRVPRVAERPFEAAVRYLRHDSAMDRIVACVEHSHIRYTLKLVRNGADCYDPNSHTIAWDPTSALRTTECGHQSPALGLGHELAHAAAPPWLLDHGSAVRLARYDNAEERRVIRGAEAHAARSLGESQRYDHRGSLYRVRSPVVC